ncbi:MAG: undecaprenyl-diphosphate phosphatase [Lachnospiraceae bacterium]|nr:undecaprenyl-diphosphate phosphatase [Lachnospiraceae bacterium]
MRFLQCILLGIVQGITEFLPISSSGHLTILEHFMKMDGNIEFLNVFLHAGTLAAIIIGMQKDVLKLCKALKDMYRDSIYNLQLFMRSGNKAEEPHYRKIAGNNFRRLALIILLGSFTTAVVGFLLNGLASAASKSLIFTGIGLMISGILMLVVSRVQTKEKLPKEVSARNALLTGVAQGFSVFPGVSRSGTVITCGILLGFSTRLAVRFSYLMSIPAVIGALVLEIFKVSSTGISIGFFFCCLAGAAAAMLAGLLVIRSMLRLVGKRGIGVFAVYCFAAGFAAIIMSIGM